MGQFREKAVEGVLADAKLLKPKDPGTSSVAPAGHSPPWSLLASHGSFWPHLWLDDAGWVSRSGSAALASLAPFRLFWGFLVSFLRFWSRLLRMAMHEHGGTSGLDDAGSGNSRDTPRQWALLAFSTTALSANEFMERAASLNVARVHWKIFGRTLRLDAA